MAPPQSSNHLVEKGQYGGKRSRSAQKRRRRHRRFIGEQHGGMAEYLPELGNTTLRVATGTPSSIVNTLQGDAEAFYYQPNLHSTSLVGTCTFVCLKAISYQPC